MRWVCLAVQPLSLTELRYALASSASLEAQDPNDLDPFLVKTDQQMMSLINSLSGGLVEVKNIPLYGTVVQFDHQTVTLCGSPLSVL